MLKPANNNAGSTNDNSEPILNLPPTVQALFLMNLGIFVIGYFFPQILPDTLVYQLALVPARVTAGSPGLDAVYPFVTHMFLHAGWMHLAVNMGMLLAFGAGLEKVIGGKRLLIFYFATGISAAVAQVLLYPHAEDPVIGASGAISGLFGGVLMLMYNVEGSSRGMRMLLPAVAAWIVSAVIFGVFGMPGTDNPIAWTMHIGGFVAGLLLFIPIRKLRIR